MEKMGFDYLPLSQIEISDFNARKDKIEVGLSELIENIQEIGIQQPIVVYKKGDKYEVIIGQRRTLACKALGLEYIPSLITTVRNDTELLRKSFSENIHRLDLSYRDKMRVAVELLKVYNNEIPEVAKHLGISQSAVRKYLGYYGVPEPIKKMVDNGKLSASTAMRIWQNILNDDQAIRIAEKIIETPRGQDKNKLIDLLKIYPDKTPDEIVALAKKIKFQTITIDLTPPVSIALTKACEETYSDPELIALEALESWLKTKRFL
jgi:ParB family chromosome partitioning protein